MKKIVIVVMICLFNCCLAGCHLFITGAINPFDQANEAFELLFDPNASEMIISKKISINIKKNSKYTGNLVGGAAVVKIEYQLHNNSKQDVSFDMIWLYPTYRGTDDITSLLNSAEITINSVKQDKTYQQSSYDNQRLLFISPDDMHYNDDFDYPNIYDDFNYSNILPTLDDNLIEDYQIGDLLTIASRFSHTIAAGKKASISITIPTWASGCRATPRVDLKYFLILQQQNYQIPTTINVNSDSLFTETNQIKEDNQIILNNLTNLVQVAVESGNYNPRVSANPYCSYQG